MKNKINYNKFYPKELKKDKTIIFTHGIAEYSKSYFEFAETLKKAGFHVITYDLKGHGKSKTPRGTVSSYKPLLDDLDYLVKEAYKNTSKVFLYGHSLGGVISNLYINEKRSLDGLIIAASPIKLPFISKLLNILPKKWTNKIKINTNFNDPNLAHNYNYQKDKYDLDFFYYKYINEVIVKGLKTLKGPINKKTPSLFIYSLNDKMANVKHGKTLYNKTINKDKTLLIYEKSRHNLHLDLEKEKLFQDVINWLNNH